MGNTNTGLALTNEEIKKSFEIGLTAESIVSLHVSEKEDELDALLETKNKEIAKVRESLEKVEKKFTALVKSLGESAVQADAKKVKESFGKFDTGVKYDITSNYVEKEGKPQIEVEVEFRLESRCGSLEVRRDLTTLPKTITDLVKEKEDLNKQIHDLAMEITDIKVALSNVGRMERKARAAITKKILKQNPQLSHLAE